jgi:hypothetical protein
MPDAPASPAPNLTQQGAPPSARPFLRAVPSVPSPLARPQTPPGFKAIVLGQFLPRKRRVSQVCLRSELALEDERAQTCQLLDALGEDALTLSVNMETLHHALDQVGYDRSAQAAAATVRARLDEMEDLEDAFLDVLSVCSSPLAAPLLANDAPLADYLRGVIAWWKGILQAFEQLASELRSLSADWATLRRRLDDASTFLLPELVDDAREDLILAPSTRETVTLLDGLDVLFATAEWLARGLHEPFG